MELMKRSNFIAVVLWILSVTFSTGFTYQPGIGYVYYETKSEIYHNATYHEQLAGHNVNGIERAYFVNADTQNTDLKPYVFEGEVTATYTMNTMMSILENQGYTVIAGINGDIYDMGTGTPKGLTIHDGKIKTSGYAPQYVICFDENGAASLEKVNLRYTLQGTINVPSVVVTDTTQPPDSTESADPVPLPQMVYTPTEYNADIGHFNVPHGESKALHLYNRQYASSTKTWETSVEVVLDAVSLENAELQVGGTITATVAEVRNGNYDTPIGDSQLVLSTVGDSACAVQLAQLIPGSQVEISVYDENGGNLSYSQEAIGVNHVLYDKGQYVSSGTTLHPRTVIGIKPDGTLMLYVLDGRQPGFSEGLGLTDVAMHLIDLGCSTVVNMDGGGSTVMAVRAGGMDSRAVAKNSPSGPTQRKTTNGLFLIYDQRGDSKAEHLHTYPSQPLAMPGADVQLKTNATNHRYEPVPLRKSVAYSVDPDSGGSVDPNGLFTAGNAIGTAVIEVQSGNLSTTARVEIQNNITFTPSVQNLLIDPGERFDINVSAQYGYAPIASKDSLFIWSCDPNIGTIDENGLFQATPGSGISGNIYVAYNGVQQAIPVQVGPASIDFADTKSHWARDYIGKLVAWGIVNGMGNNYYLPDDSLTRAQFLTMLANTVEGLDVTQAMPADFKDVPAAEWYYNYVNWGFEKGIVRGMDNITFAPSAPISREQMATMLDNFTHSIDLILPQTNTGIAFTDSAKINPWAADSVKKIVSSGLMGGYPEGTYKPQGNATRAEAATVIYKLIMTQDKH